MSTQVKSFVFSPFQENTYVLFDATKECVIIDPGCYDKREEEELKSWINANGLVPKILLNTHSHLDHVFGNGFVAAEWGLTPQVHPLDQPIYEQFELTCKMYGLNSRRALPNPEYSLDPGRQITFGTTTLDIHFVPGHCPGHVAFECKQEGFIIGGDVLFKRSIGRTDLPGGSFETLIQSIKEKMFKLDDRTIVYTGHGPATTIGEERLENPFVN